MEKTKGTNNMTVREKFKKRKMEYQEYIEHPDNLPLEEKVKKLGIRKIKVYTKQKCSFHSPEGKQCHRLAIGKGQLCKKHGGKLSIDSTLSMEGEKLLRSIALSGSVNGDQNTIENGEIFSQKTLSILLKDFQPEFHPLAYIELSRNGLSEVEIAAKFEVGVNRLREWVERFESFSLAHDIGDSIYEAWWLNKGKEGLEDARNFNTLLYKFLTGNKLGYSDKVETKSFNTNVHGVLMVPGMKTVEEWEAEKG